VRPGRLENSGESMNYAIGRWLKAGALMFVAVLVIAACEGPAGVAGAMGDTGATGTTGEFWRKYELCNRTLAEGRRVDVRCGTGDRGV
jgi:hypothetical protein